MKGTTNSPTQIAVFDSEYRLTAIFRSISEASAMTGTQRQQLQKAASGNRISAKGQYWRTVPSDFQLEPDDIGRLTLFEFDQEVGEDRRIYADRKMIKNSIMLESEYLLLKQRIKNAWK